MGTDALMSSIEVVCEVRWKTTAVPRIGGKFVLPQYYLVKLLLDNWLSDLGALPECFCQFTS